MSLTIQCESAEETYALGKRLGQRLAAGSIVALKGQLGSGKTCLAQGICHGLGVSEWANSPTFTLINEYQGSMVVFHCDFYRLNSVDEIEDLGLVDIAGGDGVTIIEWPELSERLLPTDAIYITLTDTGPETRQVVIESVEDFDLEGL